MTKWLKIVISFALFVLIIIIPSAFLAYKYPTTSPFKSTYYYLLHFQNPHAKMKKETIGFLAYWRAEESDISAIQNNLLSEIIYFSLSVDKDGNIIRVVDNETDPGWLHWRSGKIKDLVAKTQILGGKFSISVSMLRNETLEAFLGNPKAQKNLIDQVNEQIEQNRLDGVNLDFEYTGSASAQLREQFTIFTKNFSYGIKSKNPETELTIDVFPLGVREQKLTDIPEVSKYFDKVIIMAYDFYATYSEISGPVAPVSGYDRKQYIFDLENTHKDFSKIVKPDKLILGIPYYGYDWPVEKETELMSRTLEQNDRNGYVEVLSYSRMRKDPRFNSKTNCKWDELAQAPWCWYKDEETKVARQAWFENNKSIGLKFDFANDKKIAGIAIWTLGYDRDYTDLWDMIKTKFSQ